ncbi:hypothetical protein CNMCM8980_006642 [Aspergillus fumigatiaffinis]|jgi:RimJ/RimL family protein N-acetyltransferase|uniref:Acyltransferase MbtK/IucB-like conserved domain-containing protein n=1 Tax=Aspergillus fumigatiaffinis TaxID=340414 RepID=A0A8H4H525_9EURO|nr:hypothetical protein CNMCM5878_007103 [Aspergillus fumigatiaffinis]KAF4227859.1 hypothetical protein CNMCM6457_007258 [Aspergillus fumigatiaffinis]KAF4236420.1 hypothetical protein CNMCM6805_007526 [Aspergillus fumigatiaffinis]KAF4247873.1 hypothetical protein CNMCM8980_006642 [Aspergillus fumigatiaffinis]
MRNTICRLPNGQSYTVTPVFGGVNFKSNDMHLKDSIIPPGWTIVLYTNQNPDQPTQDSVPPEEERGRPRYAQGEAEEKTRTTRFTTPTLSDDCFYISFIVNPPSTDFKPPVSPTRQIAMMIWVSLYWYFHEPEPDLHLQTDASSRTPLTGKPKGEWRIHLKREGIFKGRNLLQKLERMGLIASEESSVGLEPSETRESGAWSRMFVSRRSFWQIDPRLFVFTLVPANPLHSGLSSPFLSPRFASPSRESPLPGESPALPAGKDFPLHMPNEGPFASSSHLPTYFPPPPTQYTFTNGLRHPVRPKPPHQGEVFYIRFIPSVGQYLSFRVPILSSAMPKRGHGHSHSTSSIEQPPQNTPSDLDLLHKWMNDPRVNAAWGEGGPKEKQEEFLRNNLTSRHSFPVLGCWDGKPFGYFEIYWVKEDRLGALIGGADNYDRGIHLLVGEQEYRGSHRVAIWLSALVHYCWLADPRTQTVMLEPRVDNEKIIQYLQNAGFYKEGEVTFPHKQSALMKIKRDSWESPVL